MNKVQKTLTSKGLIEYSENETLIYSFIEIYGYSDFWIKDVKMLSEFLGRSVHSVKKQMCNIRFLLGKQTRILTDYSDLQFKVFNRIKSSGYFEMKNLVKDLIRDDYEKRKRMLKVKGYDIDYLTLIGVREVEMV